MLKPKTSRQAVTYIIAGWVLGIACVSAVAALAVGFRITSEIWSWVIVPATGLVGGTPMLIGTYNLVNKLLGRFGSCVVWTVTLSLLGFQIFLFIVVMPLIAACIYLTFGGNP